MSDHADWRRHLGPAARRRELLAWSLSALTVALTATAAAALALRVEDRPGQRDALQEAVYLDLAPEPPQAAALAAPDFAPETPMLDAPEAAEPPAEAEAAPDLAPRPEDIRPPTALAALPRPAPPLPESFSPEPPPEPEVRPAEAPAPIRPQRRPDSKKEPEKRMAETPRKAAAPPPQQAAAPPTPAPGRATTAASRGQLADLKAQWGGEIRARIQRRTRGAGGASGEVEVRLTVARAGTLVSVTLTRSSGNARLDEAALRAVRTAGRFPAAPAALTGATHAFSLPISFSR